MECSHGFVSYVFCDICWEEHEKQKEKIKNDGISVLHILSCDSKTN